MNLNLSNLGDLVVATIKDPATMARNLIQMDVGREVGWMMLGLSVVLNVMMVGMGALVAPEMFQTMLPGVIVTPITFGLIIGSLLVISIFAIYFTGQILGGEARFEDIVVLNGWLNLVMTLLFAVQLVVTLAIPVLGLMINGLRFVISVRCYLHFTKVIFKFNSIGKAFFTLVLAFMGSVFGISLILALIGFGAAAGGGV